MKQLIYQFIYNEHVNYVLRGINKFFSPILPTKLRLPPSGTIKVRFNDTSVLLRTNQTSYLTQLLYWNGPLSFEYTDLFLELIKEIDCFLDVGANIGYYSLLAAAANDRIQIISFEPASGPLFFLRANVSLNKFSNIKVEPVALSDSIGELDFFEVKNDKYAYMKFNLSGEGNAGSKKIVRNFHPEKVQTITLDEYAAHNLDRKVGLIKLDTEGTENLILQNGSRVISEMKPIIICETLFGKIEDQLEELMKDHGYLFFNHTEMGLQAVNSIHRTKDNGIRNCFFVHPSKKGLIEKFLIS